MTVEERAEAPPAVASIDRAEQSRIFYGWWLVLGAFVAMFTTAAVQGYVAGAFFVPMSDDLRWTRAEFLLGPTSGQIAMAFIGFFIGGYVDRLGPRRPMLLGVALLTTALAGASLITELWQWILLRGVLGMLGAALLGNLVVNITLSKWFVEQRARAIGLASIGVSLAGVVMPPLMTWAVDEFGWRTGWRILAVGTVVLGVPTALIMRRQPEDMGLHPDGKSSTQMASGGGAAALADYANSFTRAQAVRTKALYQLVIAFGLGTLGLMAILIITIPYLTDSGFSRGTAALMVSVLAIPAGVSKPVWGYMADHWSERLSTALSFLMNAVALVLIVGATQAHTTWLLAVGYFIVGWGIGGQIPLQETIWASYFGRRHIGAVRSTALPSTMLLGASGPILVAFYYDVTGSYDGAIYAVAAGWAAAAWIIALARRPMPPARDDGAQDGRAGYDVRRDRGGIR